MDWWKAIYPTLGGSIFVSGSTLLGVVLEAVESAPESRHLTMNTPVTYIAVGMVVVGVGLFLAGMTEQSWLPGMKGAQERADRREAERDALRHQSELDLERKKDAASQRRMRGPYRATDWAQTRRTDALEANTAALREHSEELRKKLGGEGDDR
jgi:hypothetical protein